MAQHGPVSTSLPEPEAAPISRFPVPAGRTCPRAARAVRRGRGEVRFLPNVFAALSWRPTEASAFFAMHDALMDKETPGLSKADREVIVVATSAANDCLYCVVAHGAIAGSGPATRTSPTRSPSTGARRR